MSNPVSTEIHSNDRTEMHLEMLSRALRHYWTSLNGSIRARRYLRQRGVTTQSIKRYGLGYAEASPQSLKTPFPNYHVPALMEVGLVKEGTRGRYDRFRDRIMFPILNDAGRVIAFGGRLIDGEGPKYLNSPETELFDKGAAFFGLPQARASIEESGEAIVVEGYLDVVMASQHDVRNCVATLGTATTAAHAAKLMSIASKRLVFCFDGDRAGQKAASRALEAILEHVTEASADVAFMFLPEDDDPDSYLRKCGAEAFRNLSKQALTLEAFILQQLRSGKDLTSCEGKACMASEALRLLSRINDAGIFYRLTEAVARDTDFTVAELITLCEPNKRRAWYTETNLSEVGFSAPEGSENKEAKVA